MCPRKSNGESKLKEAADYYDKQMCSKIIALQPLGAKSKQAQIKAK